MQTLRVHLLALVVIATVVMGAAPAAADCTGPTIQYDGGDLAPGAFIEIRGTGFGDACHEPGPPPPGEGVLGVPLSSLEIVMSQGEAEFVVATGHADANYEFVAEVVIPTDGVPGPLSVDVRRNGASVIFDDAPASINVLDVAAVGPAAVVVFGPEAPVDLSVVTADVPDDGPDDSGRDWVKPVALVVLLGLIGVAIFLRRKRTRPSSP